MRRSAHPSLVLVFLAGTACTDAPSGKTSGSSTEPPLAELVSHADGDVVVEGELVRFFGTASDPDTFTTDLQFSVWLDGVEQCGLAAVPDGGAVDCELVVPTLDSLSGSSVLVDLEVQDPDGGIGKDTIAVEVQASDAPVVTVLAPDDGGVAYADVELVLLGDALDDLDGPDALVGTWESDVDGVLDAGPLDDLNQLTTSVRLRPGPHTLTLSVEDSAGHLGTDAVSITVFETNTEPLCAILSPASNSAIEPGGLASFDVSVDDPEQGPAGLPFVLLSNLDGELASLTADATGLATIALDTLSEGTHAITLETTDGPGLYCSDTITFSVGTPPELTRETPRNGALFNEGEAVGFSGTVTDIPSAPDDLDFTWVSDLDGPFSTEGADSEGEFAFEVTDLSAGTHVITVTVTDRDGMYVNESFEVNINDLPGAPTVGIEPDPAGTEDDLYATILVDSTDAESHPVTYTYAWAVDGTPSSASTTATLPASATTRGETWTVSVTPDDGYGTGDIGTASLTIRNTPPVLSNATLSPGAPVEGDTLSCTPGTSSDVDGDSVLYSYAWTVGGSTIFASTNTLDDSYWSKGDVVACIVTPNDGFADGAAVSSSTVTIGNTAPEVASVSISPTTPGVTDTLTCSYTGFSDVDGDADASTFTWTVGGTIVGSSSTLSGAFVKGDSVICTVTPSDGTDSGSPVAASVTVQNTEPSITAVSISPASPQVEDTLTCSYTGFSDPDGDADASTFTWTVDGLSAGTGSTLSGAFFKGDTVQCAVTPSDGTDTGTPVAGSVTIQNTAPVLTSATLSPTTAAEGDTLTCTPGAATDVDGDTISYTYAWTVDGSTIAPTTATLSDTWWNRDEQVSCTITPTDGTDTGTAVASNAVTIDNTAPELASATVTPASPLVTDTLTCTPGTATDIDGDTISYTYEWTIAGTTVGTGSTLSGAFVKDDTVTCTVTPTDGTDAGATASDAVTIDNTAPVTTSVSISPATARVADTLTCSATGTDDDGDSVSFSYAWSISGTAVGSGSTLSGAFSSGDTVTCTATPTDGTDAGTADSADITISNTAPVMASVSLTPTGAREADTLTCTPSATDIDGDTVSYSYAWTVDGTDPGVSTATLTGASFDRDQDVVCTVTPNDGTDSGASMASSSVTIDNTAPVISVVAISPITAQTGDTLTCTPTAADIDGDSISYTYSWTNDGSTIGSGSTVSTGFVGGDTVTCTATPSDGTDTGSAVAGSITIDNTAPVMGTVSISPTAPQVADTLSCSGTGTDADGDSLSYTFAWTVSGSTVGTSSTLSGAFSSGDSVTCTMTASDGSAAAANSSSVTIQNTAPTISSVELTPTTPYEADTLTCSASATDADGDSISYTYAWSVDGADPGVTTATLTGTSFDRDQDVVCTVTPTDGTDAGSAVASNTVTVENTSPSVSSVSISPASPQVGDTLTCTYSGYSDADGDADASTYSWTIDGATVGTSSTLSGVFVSGETVVCTVTPNDGTDTGIPVADSVSIENTAPVLTSVTVTPTSPTVSSTLTCTPSATDADGDSVSYAYSWTISGAEVGTSSTLSGVFVKNDAVVCNVTPTDGTDTGGSDADSVTILNSAPSIASASIAPSAPDVGDTLTVSYSASDADADTVSISYSWFVNGASVSSAATISVGTYANKGDDIYVVLSPSDGSTTGIPAITSSVTVQNSAPTTPSIDATDDPIATIDDILCAVTGASTDADGDTITYFFEWEADGLVYPDDFGSAVGPDSTFLTDDTVPAEDTDLATDWTCSVFAADGTEASSTVTDTSTTLAPPADITGGRADIASSCPTYGTHNTSYVLAQPFTITSAATVTGFGVGFYTSNCNTCYAGVYEDNGGKPGTLLGETSWNCNTGGTNTTSLTTPFDLTTAGTYWVAHQFTACGGPTAYICESSTNATTYYQGNPPSSLPASFTSTSVYTDTEFAVWVIGY